MALSTRLIGSKRYIHLSLSSAPQHTLCGFRFTPEGKADTRARDYEFARAEEPFSQLKEKTAVTCPNCCEIIEAVKDMQTEPTYIESDPEA